MKTGLNFGSAIDAAKNGELISREGWNGKGMFVFMRPGDTITVENVMNIKTLPAKVKDYFFRQHQEKMLNVKSNDHFVPKTEINFTPYLCMKAADGTVVNGWLASQTDMLAEDWCVL